MSAARSGEEVAAVNVVGPTGAPAAAAGYDHQWFRWTRPASPVPAWPGGVPVAVAVVVDLGAVEWEEADPPIIRPPGGRGPALPPDYPRLSHREFGHRVGVFRLLDVLGECGVPASVAVDVLTVECYPALMAHLARRGVGEYLAHGLSASRPITAAMSADEEADYIATTLARLEAGLGHTPPGWLGPEYSESARTPALLAQAGVGYVADWVNDERPYPMQGAAEPLWALPLAWELADVNAVFNRDVDSAVYGQSIIEAFDQLVADGVTSPRLLALHLHPWLSGQAFRADALQGALGHIAGSGQAWLATPGQIVTHCAPTG